MTRATARERKVEAPFQPRGGSALASENVARPPDADAKAPPREATTAATGWRRWVPWALVVLACVLALVAALNVWVKRQALSTDNFTNASSQLIEDPDIRSAISVYLVNQLYQNVDVGQALEQRLPPAAKPLAPTIAAALQPALDPHHRHAPRPAEGAAGVRAGGPPRAPALHRRARRQARAPRLDERKRGARTYDRSSSRS